MTKEKMEKLLNDDALTRLVATFCLILCVALVIWSFFIYPTSGAVSVLVRIFLMFVGSFIGYFSHNIIHELFHALFAFLSGSFVTEVSFCGLKISKFKPKISFEYSSLHAGWTVFYAKNPLKVEKSLKFSLIGGLVGSLLTIALFVFLVIFIKSGYTFELFIGAASSSLYMLLINFLPFSNNDGSLLFKTSKESYIKTLATLEVESKLFIGETLEKSFPLSIKQLYGHCPATYYDCLYMLVQGDLSTAKLIVDKIIRDEKTSDSEMISALMESFFIACIEADKTKIDNLLTDVEQFFDKDLSSTRAHIAYRLFTGENEWARLIASSYSVLSQNCRLKGLALTDKKVFDKFITPSLN